MSDISTSSTASASSSAVLPATGFLRQPRVLAFVPFSRATLWRRVKSKTFPAPVKLSDRITAWRAEDIRRWIDSQGVGAAAPLAEEPAVAQRRLPRR